MKYDPAANPPSKKQVWALSNALVQSEEVKNMVVEAADDLALVNAVLRQEVAGQGAPPGVEEALEQAEIIEEKVHVAAEKLSEVNLALKQEVRERHVLEFRLAAVTERAEAIPHRRLP